jgi:hypothetical protein
MAAHPVSDVSSSRCKQQQNHEAAAAAASSSRSTWEAVWQDRVQLLVRGSVSPHAAPMYSMYMYRTSYMAAQTQKLGSMGLATSGL